MQAAASPSSQSVPRPWRPSAAAGSSSPSPSPSPSPQPYSPTSGSPSFAHSAAPSQFDDDETSVSASTSRSRSRSRARSQSRGRNSDSDDESDSRARDLSSRAVPAGRTPQHPMQVARAKVQQRRAEQRAADLSCQCVTPSNLGCVERVLHLLHAAPPAAAAAASGADATATASAPPPASVPFRCNIPESVVFSPHGSTAWYCTDSRTGALQRRPDSALNLESVLAVFAPGVFDAALPAVPPGLEGVAAAMLAVHGERGDGAAAMSPLDPRSTQIFAQFVYSSSYSPSALGAPAPESENEAGSSDHNASGGSTGAGGGYIVYLTALELLRLLRDINPDLMAPRVFGVLQRFQRPADDAGRTPSQRRHPRFAAAAAAASKQTVYKLLWTPHYFAAECRVNSGGGIQAPANKPDDGSDSTSSNVFERMCTFDGPAHCSTLTHLSTPSTRRSMLEQLCASLVARLQAHLPALRVKYMELFVRLVPGISGGKGNEKAVLQYVRSMRVSDLRSADANQPAAASQHTLCMQCERSVDFRLSRSLAPAAEESSSAVPPTTTFVGQPFAAAPAQKQQQQRPLVKSHRSQLFDFGLRNNVKQEEEEEAKQQPLDAEDQRLALTAAPQPQPLQSMPRPYHPPHLRSHPTSFHSVLTPYELSAALGFQLLAPELPAESLRSLGGGLAPSGRPQLAADVRVDSHSLRRRGHSLVDAYPNARPQSAGPPIQPALAKYKNDVMGLYTADLSASRRKQLLVALRASLPQSSSTSFSRGGPAPSISTCHRFLDVQQPSRGPSAAPSRNASRPASAAPPSSGDRNRQQQMEMDPTSHRAVSRKPPPSHVWSSALHASFRQKPMLPAYMQQHQPRPKSSGHNRPSSSPRLTLVQRQQQHALVARPSTATRPHTAAAAGSNLYHLDPQSDYLHPTPSPEHYLLNPFDELTSSPGQAWTDAAAEEEPNVAVAPRLVAKGIPRARFPSAPSSKPSPYSAGRARGQKVARVVPVRVSFERYFAEQMKHAKGDMQRAFGPNEEEANQAAPDVDVADVAAFEDVCEEDDAFDGVIDVPEASLSTSGRASTRASTVGSPLSPRSRRMSQDGGSGVGAAHARPVKDALFQPVLSTPTPPPAPSRPRSYADVESSRVGVLPPSKVQQQLQASPYSSGSGGSRKSAVSFASQGSKPGSKRGSTRASGGGMIQLSPAAKVTAVATSAAPARSPAAPSPPRPVASPFAAAAAAVPSHPPSHAVAAISDSDVDDEDGAYDDDADFAALESEAAATHALHSSSRPASSKVASSSFSSVAHDPVTPPAEDLEVELHYHDDEQEQQEERYIDDAEAAATLATHATQQWALTPVAHDQDSVIAEEDPEAEYAEEWS